MFTTPYNDRIRQMVLAIDANYANHLDSIDSGDAYNERETNLRNGNGAYGRNHNMGFSHQRPLTRNQELTSSTLMPLPSGVRSGAFQTPNVVLQSYHTGGEQYSRGTGAYGGAMSAGAKMYKKRSVSPMEEMEDDEEGMFGSGQIMGNITEKDAKNLIVEHLRRETGYKKATAKKIINAAEKHLKKTRPDLIGKGRGKLTGSGFFSSIWHGVKHAASSTFNGVKSAAKYVGTKVIEPVASEVNQLGVKAANDILDTTSHAANTAIDTTANVTNIAAQTASNIAPQVAQIVAENPELLLAAGKPRGRGRPRKNGGAYAMGLIMPSKAQEAASTALKGAMKGAGFLSSFGNLALSGAKSIAKSAAQKAVGVAADKLKSTITSKLGNNAISGLLTSGIDKYKGNVSDAVVSKIGKGKRGNPKAKERGAKISAIMKQHKVSLGEASKILKQMEGGAMTGGAMTGGAMTGGAMTGGAMTGGVNFLKHNPFSYL